VARPSWKRHGSFGSGEREGTVVETVAAYERKRPAVRLREKLFTLKKKGLGKNNHLRGKKLSAGSSDPQGGGG